MKINKTNTSRNSPKFDMGIYSEDKKENKDNFSINDYKKPLMTNLKSKFSPGEFDLQGLSQIKVSISKYAIKVAQFSQNPQDLWQMYGCLNEYWARIHDIFGTQIIDEVEGLKSNCVDILMKQDRKTGVDYKVHYSLLKLRDAVYKIAQRSNLSIEVQRISNSYYDKAKKGIVE